DEALRIYEESLAIDERLGDEQGRGATLNNMAIIHEARGAYVEAMRLYKESLAIRERLGDVMGASNTLFNLSLLHEKAGRFKKAVLAAERALALAEKTGVESQIADCRKRVADAKAKGKG
ncbi:MAG: tetratricopeptide repeat protein, partial [Planctomycetes bacterium]|nr:tetratricopeptide repeat protein [Planctomycetota bacterium]